MPYSRTNVLDCTLPSWLGMVSFLALFFFFGMGGILTNSCSEDLNIACALLTSHLRGSFSCLGFRCVSVFSSVRCVTDLLDPEQDTVLIMFVRGIKDALARSLSPRAGTDRVILENCICGCRLVAFNHPFVQTC